jgi:hypothetical protein
MSRVRFGDSAPCSTVLIRRPEHGALSRDCRSMRATGDFAIGVRVRSKVMTNGFGSREGQG